MNEEKAIRRLINNIFLIYKLNKCIDIYYANIFFANLF